MKVSKNSTAIAGKETLADHNDDPNGFNNLINILEQDDSSYTQLLQQLPVAIYTCNAIGQLTFYNEAAVSMWGKRPEIGKDLWCGSWKIFRSDNTPMPLDDCPMAVALKERRPVNGH